MDALLIHEANDVPYRSKHDGCMHACGHDMMAGGAFSDITFTGKGSHGARPEEGIDPVLTAGHVTMVLVYGAIDEAVLAC
jgi:metal-dependent amidase/aminoacylase/carboxypeptidase family protein